MSAYASAHPWEDWAETWAHYPHIVDALETATGFGLPLAVRPASVPVPDLTADSARALQSRSGFDSLLASWLPLTFALNSLNRGIGLPDLYPFVLAPNAVEKLRFVHEVIAGSKDAAP